MRSPEQMSEVIATRIGHIYFRPLMYGGTASGVALILGAYHEIWAVFTEQEQVYELLCRSALTEEIQEEIGFDLRDKMNDPVISEEEKAKYVVTHWRRISTRLNVPISYRKLRLIFKDKEGLKDLFLDEQT